MKRKTAFTLIELLIVVAIIGILAAIAVPNFMNAQVRAKVSRVKADMRNYGTALESYFLDQNDYPRDETESGQYYKYLLYPCAYPLTTPVAYVSDLSAADPFLKPAQIIQQALEGGHSGSYSYFHYQQRLGEYFVTACPKAYKRAFSIISQGPNFQPNYLHMQPGYVACPGGNFPWNPIAYASSNGLTSAGDIGWFGGAIPVSGLLGG